MNSSRSARRTRPAHLNTTARIAAGCAVLLVAASCHSVHSLPASTTGAEGIPYQLPAGAATLTLAFTEKGEGAAKRISPEFTAKTTNYPDPSPSARFYLKPDNNGFFGTHHTISVSNGLLTSVSTVEDGKLKDTVLALADTGINIAKLKYGLAGPKAQGGAAPVDIFLNDSRYPTEDEIAFVLSRVAGSSISVNLLPETPPHTAGKVESVAGAGQFLELRSTLLESTLSAAAVPSAVTLPPEKNPAGYGGVYTRSLRPYLAGVELVLKLDELRKLRHDSYRKAREERDLEIKRVEADNAQDGRDKERLATELAAAETTLLSLTKQSDVLLLQLHDPAVTGEARTGKEALRASVDKSLATVRTAVDTLRTNLATVRTRMTAFAKSNEANKSELNRFDQMLLHYAAPNDSEYLVGHAFVLRTAVSLVALPDPQSIVRVPITRAPIGETTNTVTFTEGILNKYESNRPSSFNEIAKIPLEVTNKLVAAVAQILQFRVSINTEKQKTKESDVTLAEKLQALDDRMKVLADKQKKDAAGKTDDTTGKTDTPASDAPKTDIPAKTADAPRAGEEGLNAGASKA